MEKTKILIVEDDLIVAKSIELSLGKLGYAVCASVPSGEEAIAAARDFRPDLVLMDIILKGEMDGIEAADRIRALYGIPVVFLTAHADAATLERAKVTEPYGYILKPFDDRDLHTAIEMALYKQRTKEALGQSELKFRTLAEESPNMIFINKQGRVVFANRRCEEVMGYRREEFYAPGFDFMELIAPEYHELVRKNFQKHLHGEDIAPYEYALIDRAGRRIETIITTRLVDFEGEQSILGIVTDITERKKTENILRLSQRILDASPEHISIVGPDYIYKHVNQAYLTAHGLSFAQIVGMHVAELLGNDVFEQVVKANLDRCLAGEEIQYESWFLFRNAGRRFMSVRYLPLKNKSGGIDGIIVFSQDITERKQAEEALRESSQLNQQIIASANEGIIVYGKDLHYKAWNPFMESLSGVKACKVLGKHPHEVFPFLKETNLLERLELALSGKIPGPLEFPFHSKGKSGWNIDTSAPLFNADGDIIGVIATVQDITERKRAEESLRASEEKFQIAFRAAPVFMVISTLEEGRLVDVNDQFCQVSGFSREEAIGRTSREIGWLLPADRQRLVAEMRETGHVRNFELTFHSRDGRDIPCLCCAELIELGGETLLLSIAIDITERKRIEDALLFLVKCGWPGSAEDFFQSLAKYLAEHLAADFICIDRLSDDNLAAQTLAVFHDGGFEDNITYTLRDTPCGDVVGQPVCWFPRGVCALYPRDEVLQQLAAEAYLGVTLWSSAGVPNGLIAVIWRRPLAEGGIEKAILQLAAIRAAGELERRLQEEKRQKLEEQLNQARKMEVIGRLAGGVAHDFNNMLGVILGYTEMLRDSASEDFRQQAVQAIEAAAIRSRDLVRQLLAFSRKQLISPKPLDLNTAITESHKLLGRVIGEDIKLVLQLAGSLGTIFLDPAQLDQILFNLAANARDAMAKGGELVLTTANVELDKNSCPGIPHVNPGPYVQLCAQDNGCGMDQETLAHIFEPFYTTKGVGKGTGMGLATVYGIIKQNNGYIDVESQPGHGTVFRLYFPRLAADVAGAPPPARETAGPWPKESGTILLVEDDEMLRDLLVSMASGLGYHIFVAASAEEAIALFEQEKASFDLLVTDIILTGMNGKELSDRLTAKQPGLKTLFISGYTADVLAHRGVPDADAHLLSKPFGSDEFARKIKELMDAPMR